MKKIMLFFTLLTLVLLTTNAVAQENNKSMEELSKEMAKPLAQICNLSFQ